MTAIKRGIKHQKATLDGHKYPHPRVALVLGAGPASFMATIFYTMFGYTVIVVSRGSLEDPRSKRLESMDAIYIQNEKRPRFMEDVVKQYGPFSQVFNGTGSAAARKWRDAVGDTGAFVEYSIPEKPRFLTLDLAPRMVHEVTSSTCSVGSINCDPKYWTRTYDALKWAIDEHTGIMDGIFFDVPLDSKAPEAIFDAVKEGWFKPAVVMPA